jgi:hypothetical protein
MLKQVLDYMDTGAPIQSLAFVTTDLKRKTGGEWIEFKECRKHEFMTSREKARLAKAQPRSELMRDPNHYDNSTRNILQKNGEIRKVHIRLLRRFNGKTIM